MEAQETKSLFDREGEGGTYNHALTRYGRGTVLLHKKLRTKDGRPMTYIVHDVYRHSETGETMVAYQALYPTTVERDEIVLKMHGIDKRPSEEVTYEKHVRPLEMFTTDRFVILGHFNQILKAMNNAL